MFHKCALAYNAEKSGDWGIVWETFLGSGRLSAWTSVDVRECYNEVKQEDDGRQSIAQKILQRSTGFLRRIIVPVEGQGRVT